METMDELTKQLDERSLFAAIGDLLSGFLKRTSNIEYARKVLEEYREIYNEIDR
jgi:hypothetical protein